MSCKHFGKLSVDGINNDPEPVFGLHGGWLCNSTFYDSYGLKQCKNVSCCTLKEKMFQSRFLLIKQGRTMT